jgi:hypothetical protein
MAQDWNQQIHCESLSSHSLDFLGRFISAISFMYNTNADFFYAFQEDQTSIYREMQWYILTT